MRDGRACREAQARPAGAALPRVLGSRSERRSSVHQQEAARMLSAGRGSIRLGQARRRAALDARRQRAGRLGDGDRHLEAMQEKTAARMVLTANGHAEVSCATADIGTGTYTIMTQLAADMLGLPLENVTAK